MSVAVRTRRLPLVAGLLAIFIGIVGILLLFAGALGTLVGLGVIAPSFGTTAGMIWIPSLVLGVVYLILGAVTLAVASGLWNQEAWALVMTGLALSLALIVSLLASNWILFVVCGILLLYLIAVRRHFY